jgi:hypothetical protein
MNRKGSCSFREGEETTSSAKLDTDVMDSSGVSGIDPPTADDCAV